MADHTGHRQRMKERAMKEGLMNFQPHEFLELILYPLIPYRDTNSIAHDLLREFGSLEGVLEASFEDLIKIKGMTQSAGFYLTMLPDMFRRYNISKVEKKRIFDTTEKLVNYFSPLLSTLTRESVYMMSLDVNGKMLGTKILGTGVVNETYMHTRDVVEEAIKRNATSVVIAHNHPSGNARPSYADITITENIITALESIGVGFIDHLIICPNTYYSFSKHGGFDLLFKDYKFFDKKKDGINEGSKPKLYKNDEYDELYDLSQLDIDYGYGEEDK